MMPCRSQGADGVDESQPSKDLSGSWRLALKVVKASISSVVAVHVKVVVTVRKQRKIVIVVVIWFVENNK